jgi:hypothetical protein
MNKRRIVSRILVSPIILALLIFSYALGCLKHFVKYIRYGGEWVTYTKGDPKTIGDIYELLKEQSKTIEQEHKPKKY